MDDVRWLALLPIALCAQYWLASAGGAAALGDLVTGWLPDIAVAPPPMMPPSVSGEVAKNERDINAQQEYSAKLYSALGKGDVDAVEVPQPDEVTQSMPAVDRESHELKCGQRIPAESVVVTRGVEIFVRSKYRGAHASGHSWSYTVEMRNTGVDTVQMLTRHWIFTDATGKVSEMKGPGARGVTPVLQPGDKWSYESGSSLATSAGAMHGAFTFETLRSVSGALPTMFGGRVGRLALSPADSPELAPCGEAAAAHLLPGTSVRATRRVIVGASIEFQPQLSQPEPGAKRRRWRGGAHEAGLLARINNARDVGVTVTAHRWLTVDAHGERRVVEGAGVGGNYASKNYYLAAGEAFRTKGVLSSATPTANAYGHYTVTADAVGGGEPTQIDAEIGLPPRGTR